MSLSAIRPALRRAFRLGVLLAALAAPAAPATADKPALTRVEVTGGRLHLSGDLDASTGPQVRAALAAHPEVGEVVLGEITGSVDLDRTIALGRWLRAEGMDTYLDEDSRVYSGGVDLFLSGVRRRMEEGARLGVHAWSDGRREATDYAPNDPEHRASRAYVRDMLGSDRFYWFAQKAAPASAIHVLTAKEIARHGLLTEPPLPPDPTPQE